MVQALGVAVGAVLVLLLLVVVVVSLLVVVAIEVEDEVSVAAEDEDEVSVPVEVSVLVEIDPVPVLEAEDEVKVPMVTAVDVPELVLIVAVEDGTEEEEIAPGQSEVAITSSSVATHPIGKTSSKITKTTPSVPMQNRATPPVKLPFDQLNLFPTDVKVREIEPLFALRANGAEATPTLVER